MLSTRILQGQLESGDHITVELRQEKLTLRVKKFQPRSTGSPLAGAR